MPSRISTFLAAPTLLLISEIALDYNIELEIYRDIESLENAVELINEIQELLSEHGDKSPRSYLVSPWFQFGYIFFPRKDSKSSLHWINQILNSSFAEKRQDLHFRAHLLNLMIHLELRNFFVMRYFVDGTKRFYKKKSGTETISQDHIGFFQ